jgi:hypothetical protein
MKMKELSPHIISSSLVVVGLTFNSEAPQKKKKINKTKKRK